MSPKTRFFYSVAVGGKLLPKYHTGKLDIALSNVYKLYLLLLGISYCNFLLREGSIFVANQHSDGITKCATLAIFVYPKREFEVTCQSMTK